MTAQGKVNRLQVISKACDFVLGNSSNPTLKNTITYNLKPVTSKKGFTLIELMVSIAIIAVLAAVGLVVYSTAQKTARISKRVQDLNALRTAIELYKTATGAYPNQNVVGTCANTATALAALVPNYMPVLPADPSGGTNCYIYQSDAASSSQQYKIRTSVASTEMGDPDYETQPAMIDPQRDGGTSSGCTIETGTATAWSFHTSGACGY